MSVKNIISAIAGFMLAFTANICPARASGDIVFRSLSVNDGLSQSTVMAIAQDDTGNIWFGTQDGLNRYDGYRFTVFRHDEHDDSSLADNNVCSLLSDGHRMWIGTSSGLSVYDASTGDFRNFKPEGRDVQISDIIADGDYLFLATDSGVVRFDRTEQNRETKTWLSGLAIQSLCRYREGILVGTNDGMYVYSDMYGNINRILPQMTGFFISDIVSDNDGFWVGTFGNGLYRLDSSLQIAARYTSAQNRGLVSDHIRALGLDNDGRLWIGTFDGLSVHDPRDGSFTSHVHSPHNGMLSHNSIRSIFIDSQHGVWLGTFYGGINYYHPLAQRFGVLQHYADINSLSDNTVSCIVEDPQAGCLWIGTNDNGIDRYDLSTGRFISFSSADGRLLSNNVKCILPDNGGNCIWVGTHNGGISRIGRRSGSVRHYTVSDAGTINNSCYALLDNGDGTLWTGTINGLMTMDKQSGKLSRNICTDNEPQLASSHIYVLSRDSEQRVWIGTATGIFVHTPATRETRQIKLFKSDDPTAAPLEVEPTIFCVCEDSHRNIWFGTRKGLFRFNASDDTAVRYTVNEGLPNDQVFGIVEDGASHLWVSTSNGLACFDPSRGTFRTYTSRDGISNNQFNVYSYCRCSDGTLYFGGIGGITRFRPDELVDNPFAPEPQITDIYVADTAANRRIRIERDSYGRITSAVVPSSSSIFTVKFVAVNPLSNGHNTYSYTLEGFSSKWYETSLGEVSYSNLNPGRYRFKVRASNNDGIWSDRAAEIEIRISPVWWQTTGAKILWIILILGVIAAGVLLEHKYMRMRMELQIERIEKQSLVDISREKIRFYMDMAHELRTPLSLIISPLQEICSTKHSILNNYVSSRLSYVYRNSLKMLHIVNQLLDYRKAELGLFKMHVAMLDIDQIAGEVFSMFEDTAQRRDMDYIFESQLNGESLPVDRALFETMLVNLLSNAFKFTRDGGTVRLSLQRGEGSFSLAVFDNGIGIDPEQQKNIFERFYQISESYSGIGLGLSIVKRMADLHQATIELNSREGATEFRIVFPDSIDAYAPEKRQSDDGETASIVGDDSKLQPYVWIADDDSPVPSDEEAGEKQGTLLVACSDGEIAVYISNYFKSTYNVYTVADGNEALELLRTLEPDIIIAERRLAGIDGLKLCQKVKQNIRTSHIWVMILSSGSDEDGQMHALDAGADAYMPMPVSIQLLSAKLQNLMKMRYRMSHRFANTADMDADRIAQNSSDSEFLKQAIRIVEENMSNEEFSSDDFSRALCMSRSNLHLKMKSLTGESTMKFIRKIRFNRACQLLLEKRYTIAEISAMVGFNSPSYFATSFKKHVGCMPTEYVKHSRSTTEQ